MTSLRRGYVEYYDVQIELVDHIANRIEDLRAKDAQLSFETALHRVYNSFGTTGFAKIKEERMRAMQRYWMRHVWSYVTSYFKLPKVLLLICLTIVIFLSLKNSVFYQMVQSTDRLIYILILCAVFLVISAISGWYLRKRLYHAKRKFLCVESYLRSVTSFGWPLLMMSTMYLFTPPSLPWFVLALISFCIATSVILWHAVVFVFPKNLMEQVQSTIPVSSSNSSYV